MYKYLLLFLTAITALNAEDTYNFEVSNPTMGEAYFNLFNAISALMQSATYGEILHLIFLLGALFVFTLGVFKAFQGSDPKAALADTAKYLVAGTALMIAILPNPNNANSKAIMKVESRVIPSYYCSERPALNAGTVDINNYSGFTVSMPNTLAFLFSTVNQIGTKTTDLAASAFSGVSTDTSVSQSLTDMAQAGFGGGLKTTNSLIGITFEGALSPAYADQTQDTANFGSLRNGDLLNSYFQEFLFQCVYMVSSPDSKVGIGALEAMTKTKNIKYTLDELLGGDNRITTCHNLKCDKLDSRNITGSTRPDQMLFTITDDNSNKITGTCGDFWTQALKPALDGINNDTLLCGAGLYNDITPGGIRLMTNDDAAASAASVNEIAINQALINMHRKATSNIYIGESINYAAGKSQAEFITQSVGAGQYMAQMLPYLQMGIRAVLYAFFPFVFLTMLLPGGLGVIKNYFSTLLWVELWSPTAAILNMFLGYFQMDRVGDMYNGGLNALTTTSIVSDANMLASVAGYLYMSVPALTWLILKGSAQMIGSISAGVSSSFAKNLDSNTIRKDIADKTKANEFNKANGSDKSMSEVLMQLETLDAGIQGGAMGKAINYTGGKDNFMQLSQKSKALKTVNDLSHAKKSSVEAQEAMGEGKAETENATLDSTKQLKDGKVNHDQVKKINEAKGVENGSKDLTTKKNMDFMADQTGADINTAEGRQKVADVSSGSSSSKFKGGFTQQVTEARQFALANGLKVNGKNPNDATVAELMEFSSTVKQEIGAQDGKNKVISNEQKEAESRSRGQASGVIKTKEDMEAFANKKFTDFKTVTGKGGKEYLVGIAEDGTVYQAQKGNFLRQRNETVGNVEKGREEFNNIKNGDDLANSGATKVQAMGVQNQLNANAAYKEKVERYTDNLNRTHNKAIEVAKSRTADTTQKIAAVNETTKQLLDDKAKDIKMKVKDENGHVVETNMQKDTVKQIVSAISHDKSKEEIAQITENIVGNENVEEALDTYAESQNVSKDGLDVVKAVVANKQMGMLNARTTTWNNGVAETYRNSKGITMGVEANNRVFSQGMQSVPVAIGKAAGQDAFTSGQISGGVGTGMLSISAAKTISPLFKKGTDIAKSIKNFKNKSGVLKTADSALAGIFAGSVTGIAVDQFLNKDKKEETNTENFINQAERL